MSIRRRQGIALIIVLWAVVLLTIILANFSFLVRTHVNLAGNFALDAELSAIAEAGVERAIAAIRADITSPDSLFESWADNENEFRQADMASGNYTLLGRIDREDAYRFGLEDESAKININTANREMLLRLEGMTPELVSALIDWRDEDSAPEPEGAEMETYAALPEPYPCKNAEFTSLEELLLVAGFDASALYGEDWNQNGELDPNENDGDESDPPDNRDGVLDRGILPYITIYSSDREQSQNGADRADINSADANTLQAQIPTLTADEAKAIAAHREENKFQQLGQLLNIRKAPEENDSQPQPQQQDNNRRNREQRGNRGNETKPQEAQGQQPQTKQNGQEQQGELVFDENRLKQIIDYCKLNGDAETPGRININTAPAIVLRTLPGITGETADAIVRAREEQRKVFQNIAELMDVPGVTSQVFIPLSNDITVRSDQFRVRSIARIDNVEMQREVIAVLDRSDSAVQTLYWTKR